MIADINAALSPSTVFVWALIFALSGCLIGALMVPVIVSTRRRHLSYMDAHRIGIFAALIGWIPDRYFEILILFHHGFREGWWVLLWVCSYTLAITTVLQKLASRIEPPIS